MARGTSALWGEPVPGVDRLVTADELLTWPDDAWRYELVTGRLIRMPLYGWADGHLITHLFHALDASLADRRRGTLSCAGLGFQLTRPGESDTVLDPAIAYIGPERAALLPAPGTPEREKYPTFAPDLAVEVASPDQHRPEMAEKARLYLAHGTRLVWVLWPARRQIDVWRPGADVPIEVLSGDDQLNGLDMLPGFIHPVAGLFS